MPSIKKVIQYSGLNYEQVLELPCDTFLLMLKNQIVDEYNSTEQGREYLKKIKRLNTTECDDEGVRKLQKRGDA